MIYTNKQHGFWLFIVSIAPLKRSFSAPSTSIVIKPTSKLFSLTNWSTVTSWTFSSSVYFLKLESDVIPWKLSLAKYKLRSPLIFPKDLFTGFIFEILFISTFSFNNLKDSSNGSKAKTFLWVTSDNGIAVSPVNAPASIISLFSRKFLSSLLKFKSINPWRLYPPLKLYFPILSSDTLFILKSVHCFCFSSSSSKNKVSLLL